MSFFSDVHIGSSVEHFASIYFYNSDPYEKKVNLITATPESDDGQPWVPPIVRTVEKFIAYDVSLTMEYLPVLGLDSFNKAAALLLLGTESPAIIQNRCFGIQCLSGTGSLRVGAELLAKAMNKTVFYTSEPTWDNHEKIFLAAGFKEARKYRYWSNSLLGLDFDGLIEDLKNAPESSVIILQVCAHNPTGVDPTLAQWYDIAQTVQKHKLFPFFDCAYLGFASGDVQKDVSPVRLFVSLGIEFFCAQSFSKNFGLSSERVGSLTIVVNNSIYIPFIKSQLFFIVKGMYYRPPSHGAKIVAYILNNSQMFNEWIDNIKNMTHKLVSTRKILREALESMETPGNWNHLTQQVGVFSYTGLSEIQSENMIKKHHIYMMHSGRVGLGALNDNNALYIAKALYETVTTYPIKEIRFVDKVNVSK